MNRSCGNSVWMLDFKWIFGNEIENLKIGFLMHKIEMLW